jgi:hypothetical protein
MTITSTGLALNLVITKAAKLFELSQPAANDWKAFTRTAENEAGAVAGWGSWAL